MSESHFSRHSKSGVARGQMEWPWIRDLDQHMVDEMIRKRPKTSENVQKWGFMGRKNWASGSVLIPWHAFWPVTVDIPVAPDAAVKLISGNPELPAGLNIGEKQVVCTTRINL
jgi:hypothetical protein